MPIGFQGNWLGKWNEWDFMVNGSLGGKDGSFWKTVGYWRMISWIEGGIDGLWFCTWVRRGVSKSGLDNQWMCMKKQRELFVIALLISFCLTIFVAGTFVPCHIMFRPL